MLAFKLELLKVYTDLKDKFKLMAITAEAQPPPYHQQK